MNTLCNIFLNYYPNRSVIRALTTGVGPFTTNSQYDAARITGIATRATTVSTGMLKKASIAPSIIRSAKCASTRLKFKIGCRKI